MLSIFSAHYNLFIRSTHQRGIPSASDETARFLCHASQIKKPEESAWKMNPAGGSRKGKNSVEPRHPSKRWKFHVSYWFIVPRTCELFLRLRILLTRATLEEQNVRWQFRVFRLQHFPAHCRPPDYASAAPLVRGRELKQNEKQTWDGNGNTSINLLYVFSVPFVNRARNFFGEKFIRSLDEFASRHCISQGETICQLGAALLSNESFGVYWGNFNLPFRFLSRFCLLCKGLRREYFWRFCEDFMKFFVKFLWNFKLLVDCF